MLSGHFSTRPIKMSFPVLSSVTVTDVVSGFSLLYPALSGYMVNVKLSTALTALTIFPPEMRSRLSLCIVVFSTPFLIVTVCIYNTSSCRSSVSDPKPYADKVFNPGCKISSSISNVFSVGLYTFSNISTPLF